MTISLHRPAASQPPPPPRDSWLFALWLELLAQAGRDNQLRRLASPPGTWPPP
ncbi:MAG TPA: hypothetical protein VGN69_06530 [Solirubrobacteraceae bacterium]|nr:hypothetical protein [Solirubrobacteraceae bacterium]